MFVLMRAVTYATLFIGLVLVFLPARVLSTAGITQPEGIRTPQIGGLVIAVSGAVIALWCVLAFAIDGRGTPAPFDPPRQLVVRGPYRYVRNPMYIGAGFALAGAALYYQAFELLAYSGAFFIVTHLFVVFYEEPTLKRNFGAEYHAYCQRVRRWLPSP